MKYEDLTIKQITEIKEVKNKCTTIGEWKRLLREKAVELGLTDSEILAAYRI